MDPVSLQVEVVQIQLVSVFNFLLLIHVLVSIGFILMVQHFICVLIVLFTSKGTTLSVRFRHGSGYIVVTLFFLGYESGGFLPFTAHLIGFQALHGTSLDVLGGSSRIFLDFLSRIIIGSLIG